MNAIKQLLVVDSELPIIETKELEMNSSVGRTTSRETFRYVVPEKS